MLSFALFLVPGFSPGNTAMDVSMTYVGGKGNKLATAPLNLSAFPPLLPTNEYCAFILATDHEL